MSEPPPRGCIEAIVAALPRRDVMLVIYPNPAMTAGPGTFIDQLIGIAGGRSVFDDSRQLWPTVWLEEVVKRRPDLLIVPRGEFKANAANVGAAARALETAIHPRALKR